jgi:glutamate/tyrosine decarboxylase-like PLP-dependent enzyme
MIIQNTRPLVYQVKSFYFPNFEEITVMRAQIEELERRSGSLEPEKSSMQQWMNASYAYAEDFIQSIRKRKSYISQATGDLEWTQIRESGSDFNTLLNDLDRHVDNRGINPASGGHLGYIPGGGIYPSALGDFLADITNRYAGIYFANPGAVEMENAMIRWMAGLFGYPDSSLGNLSSGGSIANLIAVTAARDAYEIKDPQRFVIYLSSMTHHCIDKAIRIAGLDQAVIRHVPLDHRFRIDPEAFIELVGQDKAEGLKPFLLVGSLGSTDTGAVDPIGDLSDICKNEGIWFHVDAAYGGFFILVNQLKHFFEGVEASDSLVIDPHKGLFLPYGIGAVLVKEGDLLKRSHAYEANYMQDAVEPLYQTSPASVSPELTKHFRGLRMWLPLRLFGLGPFRYALEEKRMLCLYFYHEIKKRGFETGPEPDLSVAIYRYVPEEGDPNTFNRGLLEAIHQDGRIFISSTMIDGVYWLRIAVLCFRTHLYHIDLLLEMLETERDRLLRT